MYLSIGSIIYIYYNYKLFFLGNFFNNYLIAKLIQFNY